MSDSPNISSIKSVDSLVLNIGSLSLLSFHNSMDIFKTLGRIIVGEGLIQSTPIGNVLRLHLYKAKMRNLSASLHLYISIFDVFRNFLDFPRAGKIHETWSLGLFFPLAGT